VREARQGYSNALHRGLAEAQGEYAVLAEPDGTFMGKDVLKRLAYADGFDLVVGTRTTRDLILARRPNMGCQLRRGNSVDVTVKIKRADGSARRTGRSSSRRDGWLCIQDAATGALRAYLASAHGAPRANPARANPADTRRHCIEQPRLKWAPSSSSGSSHFNPACWARSTKARSSRTSWRRGSAARSD